MEYMNSLDPYVIPGTDVLNNKLGTQDQAILDRFQKEISFDKIYQLRMDAKKTLQNEGLLEGDEIIFNEEHFRRLHYFIFSDIYPFAGEYRKMDIVAKGRPPAPPDYIIKFMTHYDIEMEMKMTLSNMTRSLISHHFSKKDEYAKWLGTYFERLIYIHPFRDGNGRVIKEYLSEFVEYNNDKIEMPPVEINWTKMDAEKLRNVTYEQTLDPSFLEKELMKGLVFQGEKENNYQEKNKKLLKEV